MSTEIQVDDETRAALLLFNERVEAAAAKERGAKRLAKAERAKDEAAATVRKLGDNADASAEEKAAAEAAYKEAVASYNMIKDDPLAGDKPRKAEAPADEAPTETSADEEQAPDTAADEAPTETSADEEQAPDTAAESAIAPATEEPDESE